MPAAGVRKSTRQRERRAEQRAEQRAQAAATLSPAAAAALAVTTESSRIASADATVDEQLIALLMRVRQCDRSIAAAFLHCGQALLKSLELLHRSPSVPQNAAVTAARAVCAHDAAEDDAAAPALAGAPALAVAPTLAGTGDRSRHIGAAMREPTLSMHVWRAMPDARRLA